MIERFKLEKKLSLQAENWTLQLCLEIGYFVHLKPFDDFVLSFGDQRQMNKFCILPIYDIGQPLPIYDIGQPPKRNIVSTILPFQIFHRKNRRLSLL